MAVSALGSSFSQVPPTRSARQAEELVDKMEATATQESAAERLTTAVEGLSGGAILANTTALDRIAARVADGAVDVQETAARPPSPQSAARAYVMVAGAGA